MPHRLAAVVALVALVAFPQVPLGAQDKAQYSAVGGDKVLHNFTGPPDGSISAGGALVMDRAGNLYGTTIFGGTGFCKWRGHNLGCGTVFELSPASGGGWHERVLYSFKNAAEGIEPYGTVTLGAGGEIYGVATAGGNTGCIPPFGQHGCGTAFELTPHSGGAWTEQTLHVFSGGTDGGNPRSNLIADAAGNLYGTAYCGGPAYSCYSEGSGAGVFFELTRAKNGTWSETVLHPFGVRKGDGAFPLGNLTAAAPGTIYGTTAGSAYEMTRLPHSSRWVERTLVEFGLFADGWYPQGGLVLDAAGNLYGMTFDGGNPACKQSEGCGVVFELIRPQPGGAWTETVLYTFAGQGDGALPEAGLTIDAAGRLFGGTALGGDLTCNNTGGCGVVFMLVPSGSVWRERVLHVFEQAPDDGTFPASGLIRDLAGNLYGTTQYGGPDRSGQIGLGTVFEIEKD